MHEDQLALGHDVCAEDREHAVERPGPALVALAVHHDSLVPGRAIAGLGEDKGVGPTVAGDGLAVSEPPALGEPKAAASAASFASCST